MPNVVGAGPKAAMEDKAAVTVADDPFNQAPLDLLIFSFASISSIKLQVQLHDILVSKIFCIETINQLFFVSLLLFR